MSSFTGDIVLKKVGKRTWEVYTPFEYHVGSEESNDIIKINKGEVTDFASVPQIFWSIFPPDGEYTAAAIVHDFLYRVRGLDKLPPRSRKECDAIFLEAMEVLRVPTWKRQTMYRAVRMFGWMPWNKR